MNAAPVFDRVYGGLKQMLRTGAIAPGTRLDPAGYAGQLAASVTPVRDALHRLAGEEMVVATSDGFHVPILSEPDLRDLYDWSHQLLLLALRTMRRSRGGFLPEPALDTHVAQTAEALFTAIAGTSTNRQLHRAIAGLNDRLHPARRAEALVLPDLGEELADLVDADLRRLRNLLGRYHRRRLAAAPEIVRALYRPVA